MRKLRCRIGIDGCSAKRAVHNSYLSVMIPEMSETVKPAHSPMYWVVTKLLPLRVARERERKIEDKISEHPKL